MYQSKHSFLGLLALLALVHFHSSFSTARAQGSLTPPGAPAATMKTLDQIEPRTPISSLPYTIKSPGSYYVTTNLTGSSGNGGILISSGNVTLDLCGYTLQGVSGSTTGIYLTGSYTNVTVHDGNIIGWGGQGVDTFTIGYSRNTSFQRLNVSGNSSTGIYLEEGSSVSDCRVSNNGGYGISIAGGEVIRCFCFNNEAAGIDARKCRVRDCWVEGNHGPGVVSKKSELLNCTVLTNYSQGVWVVDTGNSVRECQIGANGNVGIYCDNYAFGNVIADCILTQNSQAGIEVGGSGQLVTGNNLSLNAAGGIVVYGSNNRIENNHVLAKGPSWGIGVANATYTNNVVIKNSVTGGTANYFNPGNNDFGPIGTAATATSPWANIAH